MIKIQKCDYQISGTPFPPGPRVLTTENGFISLPDATESQTKIDLSIQRHGHIAIYVISAFAEAIIPKNLLFKALCDIILTAPTGPESNF